MFMNDKYVISSILILGRYYFYPHLTSEETSERLSQLLEVGGCTGDVGWSQSSNPSSLTSGLKHFTTMLHSLELFWLWKSCLIFVSNTFVFKSTSCLPSPEKCSEINSSVCPFQHLWVSPLHTKLPLKSIKALCVCEGKQGPWRVRGCVNIEGTYINHFYFLGKWFIWTSNSVKCFVLCVCR